MEFISAFTEEILKQLMPVLVSALIVYVAKAVGEFWTRFKADKPDVAYNLEYAARMAVAAAEKAGIDRLIEDKKNYAIGLANTYLQTIGLKIDLNIIANAIEEAGVETGLFNWANPTIEKRGANG